MKIRLFQSDKGDCLLVTGGKGGRILVDGGMRNAFTAHVRAELGRMAKRGEALDLVCVSHIDQDHISGVLELLDGMMAWRVFDYRAKAGDKPTKPASPRAPKVKEIWHNAFSMLLKDNAGAVENLLAQSSRVLALSSDPSLLAIANAHHELAYSVSEAIQVSRRISSGQLAIPLNAQFDGKLIMVRSPAGREARIGAMDVYVIGPFSEDVDILRDEWNTWLRENKERLAKLRRQAADDAASIGNSADRLQQLFDIRSKELGDRAKVTAPNLASVMLLVEEAGKVVLLTGDGHGKDILQGLDFHGRLDAGGRIHVDLLKVQHHGSEHNIDEEFCRQLSADQYVFCGNGKHENPDLDVLETLLRTNVAERPRRSFKLWFNCASSVAPDGAARTHMEAVEKLVGKHVAASGGRISATFLAKSSVQFAV